MHYLTQYYKNLSEQLQAQIQLLEQKLDKVGKENKDINNDGVVNSTDDYLLHRREVIGDAIDKDTPEEIASKERHRKSYEELSAAIEKAKKRKQISWNTVTRNA